MSTSPQLRTVEAEEFILKDGKGNTRAKLSMVGDEPQLVLFGSGGQPQIVAGFSGGESHFIVADGKKRM